MSPRGRPAALLLAIALLSLGSTPVSGARVTRHSGVIADVDARGETFVLAELGPWRVRDGRTVVTHRTVAITPATQFAIVFREQEAPSGYRDDFVETPLEAWAVYVGDFVTVECEEKRGRLTALKITVADLPGGGIVEEESR